MLGPAVLVVLAMAVGVTPQTCSSALCVRDGNSGGDHRFTLQGGISMLIKFEDTKLTIQCENTSEETPPLEEHSVPVFRAGLLVSSVTVVGCPASRHSYGTLFTELNITFVSDKRPHLRVDKRPHLRVDKLRGASHLTRQHFAGLSTFGYLELLDVGPLSPAFLEDLDLERLTIADSPIPQSEFYTVFESFHENSTLASITLQNTTVRVVPAAVLALPALRVLKVLESGSVVLERPPAAAAPLHILHVDAADEDVMSAWAPPAVNYVTLVNWAAPRPSPVPACASLQYLTVKSPRADKLPPRWVAACPLELLEVKHARLRELPQTLLANATSLKKFLFTNGVLETLPRDLFNESYRLASIDLTDNHLTTLPSDVFFYPRAVLRELRLGRNRLAGAVLAAGLGDLSALTTLVLAHNTNITDPCGGRPIRNGVYIYVKYKGESGLRKLTNLTELDLKNTSVRVICKDWRVHLTKLKTLDLSYTKINHLAYTDLEFSWSNVDDKSVVRLDHTPLAELEYGPEEYAADKAKGARRVRFTLGGPETRLPCDCAVYWPAVAVLDGVLPLNATSLWCNSTSPHKLDRAFVDTLVCERAEACAAVPDVCRCGVRDMAGGRTLLRVACAAAGLTAVPRLAAPPPHVRVELLLRDNDIAELRADDLPPDVQSLDLRNNSLERVEEGAALALVAAAARGGRVLLAGGRLACDCRAAAALRLLRRLPSRPDLTCDTGESVDAALAALRCDHTTPTTGGGALATTLGAVALLAALGCGLVAHPASRRRLKALLGSLRDERPPQFDLFLTFGAGCERQALEVVGRLEPRYAVCLQERDWVPPARVATCLAQSVAASRRTVALVSAQWAEALDERTAEGAALAAALRARRLVAVLLEPPPAGALRRYLARHPRAALHYADPDFWQKLSAALPAPAPPSRPAEIVSHI